MNIGESVTLAALKRSSLYTSSILPTHIHACTVRLRYPAGNREVAFPVDQVSGPTYMVSLRKACISPLLHPETASPFQGLRGIRTAPLRRCGVTSAKSTLRNLQPLSQQPSAARITAFFRCTKVARGRHVGDSSTSEVLPGIAQMQPRVQAGLSPDRECTPEQFHISLCRLQRLLKHKQLITSTLVAYRRPSFEATMGIGSKHCEGGKKKPNVLRIVVLRKKHPVEEPGSCSCECIHPPISIVQNMDLTACSVVWRGCGSLRHIFRCGAVIQKAFCDHQSGWPLALEKNRLNHRRARLSLCMCRQQANRMYCFVVSD